MPKALAALLPVLDGRSEKIELFDDLFENNIKKVSSPRRDTKNNLLPLTFRRKRTPNVL